MLEFRLILLDRPTNETCDSVNTSKWTNWVRSSKLSFCCFLNGCSVSSIPFQKVLQLDIVVSRHTNFIDGIISDQWKVDLERQLRLLKFGNLWKVHVYWCTTIFQKSILLENAVFTWGENNLVIFVSGFYMYVKFFNSWEIKYWRFLNMWMLKINLGTIIILRYFYFAALCLKIWVFLQLVPFDILSYNW